MQKFIIFLLFFIIHSSLFISHCSSQWVQQTLATGGTAYSMHFFNQNTGLIVLYNPLSYQRTTNGGFNWNVIMSGSTQVGPLNFINDTVGFTIGSQGSIAILSKTTDGGLNWVVINTSGDSFIDIYFVNKDTGWICGLSNFGKIWRTTDGGQSLQVEVNSGSSSMDKIFFLKTRVNGEYWGWCSQGPIMRRTTNSGVNWVQIATQSAGNQIQFINKDTGWASNGNLYKSTNGGVNWVIQQMPNDTSFMDRGVSKFVFLNNNLGYGVGGNRVVNSLIYGVIWKTTNGGMNWGYQQPDTSIHVGLYSQIDFIDSFYGWAYSGLNGIHTINGGGPLIMGIKPVDNKLPEHFKLYQNFPNPFNPLTSIQFQISVNSNVKLIVYDILGKEIITLINEKESPGTYKISFNGSDLSSGVYFYTLFISDFKNNLIYKETKNMIYLK
jgi:photosystem II stability/assembly factor-like uncharacterized protein